MSSSPNLLNLRQYRFQKRPAVVLHPSQTKDKMDNENISFDDVENISDDCEIENEPQVSDSRTKSPREDQNENDCIPESPNVHSTENNTKRSSIIIDSDSDVEFQSNNQILINGTVKRPILSSDEEVSSGKTNPLPSTSLDDSACSENKYKKNKFKRLRLSSSDDDEVIEVKDDSNSCAKSSSSSDNDPNEQVKVKRKRLKAPIDSDEDNDVIIIEETSQSEKETVPEEESQEEKLQFLEEAFPNYDKMELQDALIFHKWSVEEAIGAITKKQRIEKLNRLVAKKVRNERIKKHREEEISDDEEEDESDYKDEELWDSDDSMVENDLTSEKSVVLTFFREAPVEEFMRMPGCSRKKAEIIKNLRPFKSWIDLVNKFETNKTVNVGMISSCKTFLHVRDVVNKLMQKCEKISLKMGKLVTRLTDGDEDNEDMQVTEQPKILNQNFLLKPYQIIGLNWLILMDRQDLNGILADEMGLGKTVQAIGFLAYLMEQGEEGPHLICVPSSTLDNWVREIKKWCPRFQILVYFGNQDERKEIRYRILNDEAEDFNIVVTTYHMVSGAPEDRVIFKKIKFHYVVFDEAHMLKNMATLRYQNLMKIRGQRRLLLTGTPLQNNLVELMSLLCFVMPHMFHGKTDYLKQAFAAAQKNFEETKCRYEESKIEHAKRIIKPFILRRLKSEVLQQLPQKIDKIEKIELAPKQRIQYDEMIGRFSKRWLEHDRSSHSNFMMELRKMANHPLLLRTHYTDDKLHRMSEQMLKEPSHKEANRMFVFEDMQVMSDFELNRLCKMYYHIANFKLSNEIIVDSGKFKFLDRLLPDLKKQGDRVLLFSQFVIVLDILEEYMKIRAHKYFRLDGSTPVVERQELIDRYNSEEDVFVFLLSTRAGGLGINLTAANKVILHDIDFNPYNDKQAEDRCHRVGQMREVTVMRLISKHTIEENMLTCAQNKLRLEKNITANDPNNDEHTSNDVATLLKQALGIKG